MDGVAAKWYELFAKRWFEYSGLKGDTTKAGIAKRVKFKKRHGKATGMFGEHDEFLDTLRTEFGELDPERRAEQPLLALKQKNSVVEYTSEFRIEAANTRLDEEALVMLFYSGLKPHVVDELYKVDRPSQLQEMVELATRVDNRYYDYQEELQRQEQKAPQSRFSPCSWLTEKVRNTPQQRPTPTTMRMINRVTIRMVNSEDNRWIDNLPNGDDSGGDDEYHSLPDDASGRDDSEERDEYHSPLVDSNRDNINPDRGTRRQRENDVEEWARELMTMNWHKGE